MALALKHATSAQLAAAFRERFRNATKEEAARLATWLIDRITDGTWTDLQVRNAFGLTAGQYTAAKARFQALHDHWVAVQAAAGE
jgi:hypothetical protein